MTGYPSYLEMYRTGELCRRIETLESRLEKCRLCPRECLAARLEGEKGFCRASSELKVASAFPHFAEEAALVGLGGSGTIFLSHCNLRCVFCQNYDISHFAEGEVVSGSELAQLMLGLQRQGCHNINFVTPTHYAAQIVAALPEAIEGGLQLPIVWNCGGYESLEVIKLLDGIVDIYMPDIKYADNEMAKIYSDAPGYFDRVKEALKEMHRQVGVLEVDARGIARRGLLIRHLVMPNGIAGTKEVMRFIADGLSKDSYVNIMDQYHPCHKASEYESINRTLSVEEYRQALEDAKACGLHMGFN
jgi:putative pyruvate formate lyase activating enzyme